MKCLSPTFMIINHICSVAVSTVALSTVALSTVALAATAEFLGQFPRPYILLKQYLNFSTANNVAG